ncbi:hypothetical protein PRJ_5290 [Pseudomonas sp. XWY-1]|nr:hypothetical protein PRJ_5290 [Pseudomonas sp. XWY-1]
MANAKITPPVLERSYANAMKTIGNNANKPLKTIKRIK